MSIDINDPATWDIIPSTSTDQTPATVPLSPFKPKLPALAPASPASPPSIVPPAGNAIAGNPPNWSKILIASFAVGIAIWLVEQNFGMRPAMILAVILLLGAAYNYKNFASELNAIGAGKA